MYQLFVDKFIEKHGVDVYPITLVKFQLNKGRILSFLSKASNGDFEIRGTKYTLDSTNCEQCKQKIKEGILCRQHTSIQRVVNAKNVLYDVQTELYFYCNEIFKMVGKRLVIVYCPHPKLINGEITDAKVRRVNPITIEDKDLTELPNYENIRNFVSVEIMESNLRCWFNEQFSIVTLPEDKNHANWCLIPNK